MNERGSLAGFLMSKLGVALAAIGLVGASISMHGSFDRTVQGKELNAIADSMTSAFQTACGLPGRVELNRQLPSIGQLYTIKISGSYRDHQIVRILIMGSENVRRTLFFKEKVNGGNFEINRKNPKEIRITKSPQIWVDVV